MAPHSSTLAWKISWREEPGRVQSMESLRVRHDWATSLWLFTFMHWRRKWQPTPLLLPGESQGRGTCWAAIYGVAQSRTRLKWLSSSRRRRSISVQEGKLISHLTTSRLSREWLLPHVSRDPQTPLHPLAWQGAASGLWVIEYKRWVSANT